jgi:hypothetical protein
LISLGLTWIHLVSLGLTWIHFDSLGFTWARLDSLAPTWIHLASLGFSWSHLDSLGLTCFHFGSLGSHKGKGKTSRHTRKKGKSPRSPLRPVPTLHPAARTHARTETEIDFPVGLTPQPPMYCIDLQTLFFLKPRADALTQGSCCKQSITASQRAILGGHV